MTSPSQWRARKCLGGLAALSSIRTGFWLGRTVSAGVVCAPAVCTDVSVETTLATGRTHAAVPSQARIRRTPGGSSARARLRLPFQIGASDVQVLDAQVPKLSRVCEQKVSPECDPFSDSFVVVEDEVVVFCSKCGEETEYVLAVVVALPVSMGECECSGGCGLVPGNKPVTGRFDCFGGGQLSS